MKRWLKDWWAVIFYPALAVGLTVLGCLQLTYGWGCP